MLYIPLYETIPVFYNLGIKPYEKIVDKREIAGNQYFLLFPQCFVTCFRLYSYISARSNSLSENTFNNTPAKQMFSGLYWNQPVCPCASLPIRVSCPSMYPLVYKILVYVKVLAQVLSHI